MSSLASFKPSAPYPPHLLLANIIPRQPLTRLPRTPRSLQAINNAERSPTDPLSSIAFSTYSTVHEILLGATEGPREAYRQLLKAKEDAAAKEAQAYDYNALPYDDPPYDDDHHLLHTPAAPPSVVSGTTTTTATSRVVFTPAASTATVVSGTVKAESDAGATATITTGKAEVNPYAAVATSTGMGVARIVGAGLKAPGVYTRGLARGFNNVPRLYGDETVREEEKIDRVASGLAAAGKVCILASSFHSSCGPSF